MTDDHAPTAGGTLGRAPTGQATGVTVELEGRYELGGVLGRGGMGEVRFAYDERIDREVAVKLMRPDQRDDATIARFFREARIQGRLEHPAVVPVHDLGIDRNGNPYFVMKRLAGITLAELLARRDQPELRDKWPRRQLLARFVDVCLAIEFAHTRQIVHRDLKPANIMLGDFGEAYVLDWGLARVAGEARHSQPIAPLPGDSGAGYQTQAGSLLGTPGYMPPEQIRATLVSGAADVYALGCILYEIVTGQRALPDGMAAIDATLAAGCHRPTARFAELAVPPELDEICARATASDPLARPTARGLGDAIQAFLDGDRDLARRRQLAAEHAGRAQVALADTSDAGRARAMQEAGRALVLDPSNGDAQGALAHLLLEAPDVIPAAAMAAADDQRSRNRQPVLLRIAQGYIGLIAAIALLFVFPVRHALPIVLTMVTTAATAATVWIASRRPLPLASPILLVAVWLNASTLAAASLVFGPLLIVPLFLIGSLAAALSQPSRYGWAAVVVPHVLAVLGPLVLEWVHVLPSTYHVDGGLVLTPWVIDLRPGLTELLMLVGIGSQGIISSSLMIMHRRAEEHARNQLHAQAWHLRQLLPRRTGDSHSIRR